MEIIPKPIEEIPSWQKRLSFVLLFIFLIFVIASFVLIFFEKKSKTKLENLEKKILETKTPEIVSLEKQILDYQKKIKKLPFLIEEHLFPSKFFSFLEKRTHPKTFFSKIDLITADSKVNLAGETESFLTLGQQISIFQKDRLVKELKLAGVSITEEGKIGFSLEISLDSTVFK